MGNTHSDDAVSFGLVKAQVREDFTQAQKGRAELEQQEVEAITVKERMLLV